MTAAGTALLLAPVFPTCDAVTTRVPQELRHGALGTPARGRNGTWPMTNGNPDLAFHTRARMVLMLRGYRSQRKGHGEWHVTEAGDQYVDLEPMRQPERAPSGEIPASGAYGLALRHNWGPQCRADAFQDTVPYRGTAWFPAFVGEPEGNGIADRVPVDAERAVPVCSSVPAPGGARKEPGTHRTV